MLDPWCLARPQTGEDDLLLVDIHSDVVYAVMVCAPFVLYVALAHAPNRTVRDRSTMVQPLGALHIVSMLCVLNLQMSYDRMPVVMEVHMRRSVCKGLVRLRGLLFLAILPLAVQLVHACGTGEQASSKEYQERPALESSLFPSDKAILNEETMQRILTSKFSMPKAIKIALFRLQDSQQQAIRYYGYGYWRSEEYLRFNRVLLTPFLLRSPSRPK